ncbi:MAG: hypothetical protein WD492_06580 [Alkalispirochaeta sp.]
MSRMLKEEHMNSPHDDPELRELWDELEAGVATGPHPFHTAFLATVGAHSELWWRPRCGRWS